MSGHRGVGIIICVTALVALALAGNASADLINYYSFDNTLADTASPYVEANGHNNPTDLTATRADVPTPPAVDPGIPTYLTNFGDRTGTQLSLKSDANNGSNGQLHPTGQGYQLNFPTPTVSSDVNLGTNWSMEFWVKSETGTWSGHTSVNYMSGTNFGVATNADYNVTNFNGSGSSGSMSGFWNTTKWLHIAFVSTGGTTTMYYQPGLDDEVISVGNTTGNPGAAVLQRIGIDYAAQQYKDSWDAILDDLAIYNTALSYDTLRAHSFASNPQLHVAGVANPANIGLSDRVKATVIRGGSATVGVTVNNWVAAGDNSLTYTMAPQAATGITYGTMTPDGGTLAPGASQAHTYTVDTTASAAFGTLSVTVADPAASMTPQSTVLVTVVDHALGSASVPTGNNFNVITGATGVTATVRLAATGGYRSGLQVRDTSANLTGGTRSDGVIAAGASSNYTATFDAPAVGTGRTVAYSFDTGDDQSLSGHGDIGTANITGNITGTVWDHSNPQFKNVTGGATPTLGAKTLTLSFGIVAPNAGGGYVDSFFDVFNEITTAGLTAGMDLDLIDAGTGDVTKLFRQSGLTTFANQAANSGQAYAFRLDTTVAGTYTATYLFKMSDQNLPGATAPESDVLTLTLTATVGSALHMGDANGDGKVDLQDFSLLKAYYGMTGQPWAHGNFNNDANGLVNLEDFSLLKAHYNHTAADTNVVAVPEPATMSLLVLAGLAALRRRNRR